MNMMDIEDVTKEDVSKEQDQTEVKLKQEFDQLQLDSFKDRFSARHPLTEDFYFTEIYHLKDRALKYTVVQATGHIIGDTFHYFYFATKQEAFSLLKQEEIRLCALGYEIDDDFSLEPEEVVLLEEMLQSIRSKSFELGMTKFLYGGEWSDDFTSLVLALDKLHKSPLNIVILTEEESTALKRYKTFLCSKSSYVAGLIDVMEENNGIK